MHDVEWSARVRHRHDRLLREEGLVRDETVVLVDGRVVDAETAGVEIGQLLVADPPGERGAAVEPACARELLEAFAVRAVARDHDAKAGRLRCRLDQEIDPLRAVEPIH